MSKTASIEDIAARLKAEAAARESIALSQAAQNGQEVVACLEQVRRSLDELRAMPSGGIRIYLRTLRNSKGSPAEIRVSISSSPPWICRPFAICSVTAWTQGDSGGAVPAIRLDAPDFDAELSRAWRDACKGLTGQGPGRVAEEVKLLAAECLFRRATLQTHAPDWYRTIGVVLAWPLAIVLYALSCFGFGVWGFLLGWIPAWLAFTFARFLWLPALVLLALRGMTATS